MDGFEVAHLLADNPDTMDISVLFVTALSYNEKYTIKGYKEGAVDYLQKPLDTSIVKAKVNVDVSTQERLPSDRLRELTCLNACFSAYSSTISSIDCARESSCTVFNLRKNIKFFKLF